MFPTFYFFDILFPAKIRPRFAFGLFFRLWAEVEVFYFYFHHITTCSVTVAVVLIGGSGFTFLTFFISERK